ncbi:MAG: hypothetical protein EOM22_17705 [Gammaproteobacteria bacterium]|nr:hypothetical protein [Gammaproteobacteria bacterium]
MKPEHHKAIHKRLTRLAETSAKTDAAERRILDAAEHRRDAVQGLLAKLKPRALLDDASGERYQDLILERGRLDIVIANARARL